MYDILMGLGLILSLGIAGYAIVLTFKSPKNRGSTNWGDGDSDNSWQSSSDSGNSWQSSSDSGNSCDSSSDSCDSY